MTEFAAPASTGGIDLKAANGHLLLITPLSVEEGINTVHGPTSAIRADIVDLDSGDEFTDVLVFPKVLQGQLRSQIGKKVLGRLGQGIAKPGQSAPWTLNAFTPADVKTAEAYIAKQQTPQFAAASDAPF